MAGAVAAAAEIVDHDFRAAPGELERISTAEPAAGAGDDGDPVLEIYAHSIPHSRSMRAGVGDYVQRAKPGDQLGNQRIDAVNEVLNVF